jgi:hypothetical protein
VPSQAFNLLARTLKEANARHGEEILFRGQPLTAVLAPVEPSFDLTTGGLSQGGEFRVQILKTSLSAPPQKGEPILYRTRSYLIKEINEDKSQTAHLVTITPGSKQ